MTTIIFIGIIIAAALIYLSTLEGDYKVDRSLIIDAPVDRVYQTIVDFKTWPEWSPWLLHEPETPLEYSDNYQQPDGFYSWDGQLVGTGKLIHLKQQHNESIDQRIEFIRPFKSVNQVAWRFKAIDDEKTEVHWIMKGHMPFLFRFMTNNTKQMISRDYDLGLNLINGFLNKESPCPRIQFEGLERQQKFEYLFKHFKGGANEMIKVMKQSFPELLERAVELDIVRDPPLTIYHKANPDKMHFDCDIAVPITETSQLSKSEFKTLKPGLYFKTQCKGDYRFLELGWYKAYCHARMLKLKLDSKRPALEIYQNNPQEVDDTNELITNLYVPVKG